MSEDSDQPIFYPTFDDDGNVNGMMDQMSADFLASTEPDPTQASLDEVMSRATRIRLVSHRIEGSRVVYDVLRLEIADRDRLVELREALRIDETGQYGHVLSIGEPLLELWAGEEHITTLELLFWSTLRWPNVWRGDAELTDPRRLAEWLVRCGTVDARDALDAEDASRAEFDRLKARWIAAMPPNLRPLFPEDSPDGFYFMDLDAAEARLRTAFPDSVAQVQALYEWYGSGAGPWSGFPSWEDCAERLLMQYPISLLLAGISAASTNDASLLGAARLLAGWNFGRSRAAERSQCPDTLRDKMMQAVQRQGIEANLAYFRREFPS